MKLPEHDYLISLLSAVINDVRPPVPADIPDWEKLYWLSVRHGLSNMVWYGITRLSSEHRPPQDILHKFKNDNNIGVAKEATQHLSTEQILKAFEENCISCLPLKGCLLKYLYPRPDMRLMSDIDILINPRQAESVKNLMLNMGYVLKNHGGNHDVYYKEPFINVEILRKLIIDTSPYSAYLSKTWGRAVLQAEYRYIYHSNFAVN